MTLIDKAEALFPCPFCGGDDLYFPHGTDPAMIECSGCGARSGVPDERTEAAAIAAWNRRAALPARGVGVRPLVWEQAAMFVVKARALDAIYRIWTAQDGITRWQSSDMGEWLEAPSPDAAKAAAQADYEASILAVLEPAPTDGEAQ